MQPIREELAEIDRRVLAASPGIIGSAIRHLDIVWRTRPVSYTHLRAHETVLDLVCRLLLEKKNNTKQNNKKKKTC